MEKLKNLLNPGAKHDDEVLYGSGKSSDPVHSGTTGGTSGQGSQAGSSHAGHNSLSSASNPPSSEVSSGYGGNPTLGGHQPGLTGNAPSRSGASGAFDDGASTASIKSGILGHPQSGSGLMGSSGSNDPVDTNKPLPSTPASGLTGGNSAAGPHTSNLANRADPRVDSDLDGSRGLGRGSAGSGLTGAGLPDRSVGSSGMGSSHLGHDAATGAGALGGAGLSEHERYGDRSATGTGVGSERIGGGIESGGQGYGPEHWTHDHHRHGHRYEGDPCAHGEVDPVGPHLIPGPHATDTANRLDPHVAGNSGPLETTAGTEPHQHGHHGASLNGTGGPLAGAGTGMAASGTGYDGQSQNRHLGREAALAGGVGATGVGAYEAEKHHHGHGNPSSASATSMTGAPPAGYTDQYSNSGVDPRVDPASRADITGKGNDRHLGRDAGVAGTGGLAAYEAEKHHHARDEPGRSSGLSGTTAGITGRDYDSTRGSFVSGTDNQSSTGHHHGRDAGLAGSGAVGGAEFSKHEAEKHRKEEGSHEGKKHGGLLGFLHHDKDSKSDHSTGHSGHGSEPHNDSHQGARTAAGVGAVGAGTAAYEHEKHDHERNRLHKDPPQGYASQVTGGTGTTVLAEGDSVQRGSHVSGLGNKLDPNVAGRGESLPSGEVIEPHTGLPINVSKYGTGARGTDDTPVPGYHQH